MRWIGVTAPIALTATLVATCFVSGASAADIQPLRDKNEQRDIESIVRRTDAVCKYPSTVGVYVTASGKLGGSLSTSKIFHELGKAGFNAEINGMYARREGLDSNGLAKVLVARMKCAEDLAIYWSRKYKIVSRTTSKQLKLTNADGPRLQEIADKIATEQSNANSSDSNQSNISGSNNTNQQNLSTNNCTGDHCVGQQNITFPPVTYTQKVQALDALASELDELSSFPDGPFPAIAPSIIERSQNDQRAFRLFTILRKYYRQTLEDPRFDGLKLREFEVNYYNFETKTVAFERAAEEKFGANAPRFFPQEWPSLYEYAFLRGNGLSLDEIKAKGFQVPRANLTDAEPIYQAVIVDDNIKNGISEEIKLMSQLTSAASTILNTAKSIK